MVTSADGVEVSITAHGDPTRPRVLLQHGVGSSCVYLAEAVAPPLVEAGWCVVAADLRGHGAGTAVTDPAHHALDRLVADVVALVDAVQPAAVGGVSLGGHAAVAAVARGVVDIDRVVAALPAWTGRGVPGVGPHAAVAAEVQRVGIRGMHARLATEPGLRPWLRHVLLRDLAVHDEASLTAALIALNGGLAPTIDELVRVTAHLAVVGWPDDPGHPIEVARQWARAAPRSTLATLTLDDPDRDPTALGRAMLAALGAP